MQINFTINIDDRIITKIRKFFTKRNNIAFVFIGIITTTAIVYGAAVTKPWDFNDGDLIDADKMNDNFDMIYNAVNSQTGFGAWQEKYLSAEYNAATDGFIFGTVNKQNLSGSSVNLDLFKLFVSGSSGINISGTPALKNRVTIDNSGYSAVPFFFPVSKGTYWAITSDVAAADIKIYWCPVGN
jgi:hypothetical protein